MADRSLYPPADTARLPIHISSYFLPLARHDLLKYFRDRTNSTENHDIANVVKRWEAQANKVDRSHVPQISIDNLPDRATYCWLWFNPTPIDPLPAQSVACP
jgi:hypothetical protein